MKRSERLARFAACLLAVYALIVLYSGPRSSAQEIFPFFKWDLFSRVPPSERQSYSVRFVEIDGEHLDAPVYFEDAGAYVSTSQSPEAFQVMQQMGQAAEHEELLRLANARDILETRYLQQLESATYEVVRRRFDLLERVDCRECFIEEIVIDEYTLNE